MVTAANDDILVLEVSNVDVTVVVSESGAFPFKESAPLYYCGKCIRYQPRYVQKRRHRRMT